MRKLGVHARETGPELLVDYPHYDYSLDRELYGLLSS